MWWKEGSRVRRVKTVGRTRLKRRGTVMEGGEYSEEAEKGEKYRECLLLR